MSPPDASATPHVALHAKQQIGGRAAPVNYSFAERVFSAQDIPRGKAQAKQEVVESLRSRILSDEKPEWSSATSSHTHPCFKRTNVNGEVASSVESMAACWEIPAQSQINVSCCSATAPICTSTTFAPSNCQASTRAPSPSPTSSTWGSSRSNCVTSIQARRLGAIGSPRYPHLCCCRFRVIV